MFSASVFCWLKERGMDVEFALQKGSRLDLFLQSKGHTTYALSTFKYIDPRTIFFLRSHTQERYIDIIHTFKSSDIWFSVLATLFLGRNRPRLLHHLQLIPKHSRKNVFRAAVYSRLDLVITISNLVKERAVRYWPLPKEKYEVLHNAVDTAHFYFDEAKRASVRAEFAIPQDALLLGQVGQICPIKGQIFVLESCLSYLKENPNLYMLIAGAPPPDARDYERALKEMIQQHGLSDRVKLTGFYEDTPALFSALDIFLLGSEFEPFGLVLTEAMATGRIVIASAVGGVPEIVEDSTDGYLYEASNPSQLREKLKQVLDLGENERKKIAQAARNKVLREFAVESFVQALSHSYQSLVR